MTRRRLSAPFALLAVATGRAGMGPTGTYGDSVQSERHATSSVLVLAPTLAQELTMNKFLSALVAGLLVASTATADVPPPPPPKGKKYVSVTSEVVLGKGVTGYVFVQQVGSGFGPPKVTYEKLDLTGGKAKEMPPGGRRTFVTLFAVPEAAAKEFKTDDALFEALKANKVKGAHHLDFPGTATVSDKVKGDSVKWTYTITEIDDKAGLKKKVEGEGHEEPAAKPKGDKPPALTGTFVAGAAAALALLLGGFWLAGRSRRKV